MIQNERIPKFSYFYNWNGKSENLHKFPDYYLQAINIILLRRVDKFRTLPENLEYNKIIQGMMRVYHKINDAIKTKQKTRYEIPNRLA